MGEIRPWGLFNSLLCKPPSKPWRHSVQQQEPAGADGGVGITSSSGRSKKNNYRSFEQFAGLGTMYSILMQPQSDCSENSDFKDALYPNILFVFPILPDTLEPLNPLCNLANLSRVKVHHNVAKLQHPLFS